MIDVEGATPVRFSTVSGTFRAYGHEVGLEVLGIAVNALVYFYEDPATTRNVLGRQGWLNRVRFGLVDYDSTVFLRKYDE